MMSPISVFKALLAVPLLPDFSVAVTLRYNATSESVDPLHVYIHVPKCAGSSFSSALSQVSHSNSWWPTDILATGCAERRPDTDAREDIIYTSHCALTELESCVQSGNACFWDDPLTHFSASGTCPEPVPAQAPIRFIMLVRLPVQRIMSEYYYFKKLLSRAVNGNSGETLKVMGDRLWTPSVKDIALKGLLIDWVRAPGNKVHNAVMKALASGDAGLKAPVLRKVPGRQGACAVFDYEAYEAHWRGHYGASKKADLEDLINNDQRLVSKAAALIEQRFDFVGLVEHFEESVARASSILGLKRPSAGTGKATAHGSNHPPEYIINADIVEEIRARNKLDTALYRAVLQSKFWKGSAAARESVDMMAVDQLSWQSVLDGDREGEIFDPSVLEPVTVMQ